MTSERSFELSRGCSPDFHQGIVTAGEYETKFVTASGGSMKRISLEFQPNAGEPIKAECKVKRGTVKELTIKV